MDPGNNTSSSQTNNPTPETIKTIGTKITIQEPLGKGAYGSVYHCTDEFGAHLAIKCIETDTAGIPCLMETSIMSVIQHPNLHRAIRIHITPKMLYIVSEMAISDLSRWTRKDKSNHIPTIAQLRMWSHSLIQAVACLHRQNIIHGDIKASNVLLFSEGIIKLTDFTLSTRKWKSSQTTQTEGTQNNDPQISRRHTICTCTHRPVEVWLNREWDFQVDIWSLGCTLYEIAYGELLFPYQGNSKESGLLREKTLNCILDWSENGPVDRQSLGKSNISRSNTDYLPYKLSPNFSQPEYKLFNSLILSMLRLDPQTRPTAFDLLTHPFFQTELNTTPDYQLKTSPYSIVSTPTSKLSDKEVSRLIKQISRFTSSSSVIQLTLEIYSRCTGIRYVNEYVKLMSALWIAAKLILRNPITTDAPLHQVLAMERTICTHLSFRLHMASNSHFQIITHNS